MGTTPILGLPFPEYNDQPDVPADMRALAYAIEDILKIGPVVTTGVFTPQPGWSLVNGSWAPVGMQAIIKLVVQRTGGTITVPANGDITNQTIAVINNPLYRPRITAGLAMYRTGRLTGGYVGQGGDIVLSSVAGGANISNGNQLELGGLIVRRG